VQLGGAGGGWGGADEGAGGGAALAEGADTPASPELPSEPGATLLHPAQRSGATTHAAPTHPKTTALIQPFRRLASAARLGANGWRLTHDKMRVSSGQ
jgi:hypothetical protein